MEKTKSEKEKQFFSIRWKYTLLFLAVVLLLILTLWIVNRYFLGGYYRRQQIGKLNAVRLQVEEYLKAGAREEDALRLRQSCETAGIRCMILQDDLLAPVVIFSNGDLDGGAALRLLKGIDDPRSKNREEIYEETDFYSIYQVRDTLSSTDQLECIEQLRLGEALPTASDSLLRRENRASYLFVLTVSLTNLSETARLANHFLLLIGLGTLVIGFFVVSLLSWHLTRPIKELSALSREMADMNFRTRYYGRSRDELHQLGDNMNEMAASLEKYILELRAANARLETDIRAKEQENEARRELLAAISHELKTPLALIEGYAEGLRDGISEDAEARGEYCDIIIDETSRMNRLVRQLMELEELESREMQPDYSCFDLGVMLRDALRTCGLQAAEKNVQLLAELPESMPFVTDEFLLEQVVSNYLSNALHHVTPGGIIRITAVREKAAVRISVYNTGSHIPEENLTQIWEKFFKVDKARTRSYGGSGIGLSVVRAIMKKLGGSCGVKNMPDGVEFTAVFPEGKEA